MHPIETPEPPRARRRDGWTAARRERFFEHLAAGLDVRRACAQVGLSREGAYRLRRRDAGFAQGWDAALAEARAAEARAFLASLPEGLRARVSARLGSGEPGGSGAFPLDTVPSVPPCELRGNSPAAGLAPGHRAKCSTV